MSSTALKTVQVNQDTLVVVSAAPPGSPPVRPMMEFLSKNSFLSTSTTPKVKLVIKNTKEEYISIGHDSISLEVVKAASSRIHSAVKEARHPIGTIELPNNNIKAYQTLFDTIQESFDTGVFTNVMTIKLNHTNTPVTAYYTMKKIAEDLSMVHYRNDLAVRISYLLFPNLRNKSFAIRAADIELSMGYSQVKKGERHFESMANAVGRAWAAKSIAEGQYRAILSLLSKEADFKASFEEHKQRWITKKAAGEDILKVY